MPVLTVIAGPNGSGKSSIILRVEFEGKGNLLEADAIARQLAPFDFRRGAIPAAREVIQRTHKYIEVGESFAIETTLAGSWALSAVRVALSRGFIVRLVYVCLNTPEHCIQRVRERVAQGGHHVPDHDIRRRYARSLANARTVLSVVDQAVVYDNSDAEPKKVLAIRSGAIIWQCVESSQWVKALTIKLEHT